MNSKQVIRPREFAAPIVHVQTVVKKKKKVKVAEKKINKAALQLANLRIETVEARVQKVRKALSADKQDRN